MVRLGMQAIGGRTPRQGTPADKQQSGQAKQRNRKQISSPHRLSLRPAEGYPAYRHDSPPAPKSARELMERRLQPGDPSATIRPPSSPLPPLRGWLRIDPVTELRPLPDHQPSPSDNVGRACRRTFTASLLLPVAAWLLVLPLGALLAGPTVLADERVDDAEYDLEIGVGFDDNAFLAPSSPYFDQNQESIVVPDKKSGFFVPVDFDAEWMRGRRTRWLVDLGAGGDFYGGSDTSDADEYDISLEAGAQWLLAKRDWRESTLTLLPLIGYRKRIYFDRDTGLPRSIGGEDISDRFSYSRAGAGVEWEHGIWDRLEIEAEAFFETRNYSDDRPLVALDHDYYGAGIEIELEITDPLSLYLEHERYVRDYDERRARDPDGRLLSGNEVLRYDYAETTATVRWRVSDAWVVYLDSAYRERDDDFVGFNDYSQWSARARALRWTDVSRWRLEVEYWERDYDNAFIFEEPVDPRTGFTNPVKLYETLDVKLRWRRAITDRLWLQAEIDYRDRTSTDPRYDYQRTIFTAGVLWEL